MTRLEVDELQQSPNSLQTSMQMDNGSAVHVNTRQENGHPNCFAQPQLPALVFTSDTVAMSVFELQTEKGKPSILSLLCSEYILTQIHSTEI